MIVTFVSSNQNMKDLSKKKKILRAFVLIFFLPSCMTPPLNRAEAIDVPSYAIDQAVADVSDDPSFTLTEWIPDDWWNLFSDEQLTDFIQKGINNNPTIQIARTKILEAKYQADRVRAALYPSISLKGDIQVEELSETALIPINSPNIITPQGFNIPFHFTQYEIYGSLLYDFDIWCKNRNLLRAAVGEIKARIADEAYTRLALSISIASTYFQLQIDYRRQEIAEQLKKLKQDYLALTNKRLKANLNDDISIKNAELNLANAAQSLIQIQGDIAVNESQLKAYLADNFEEEIVNMHINQKEPIAIPLPSEIPLHLIAHRPDIMTQIWLIHSACRKVKAAEASFYPDLNLMFLIGFQTIHLGQLFEPRSTFFDFEPAFALPLFDGGLLDANLKGSQVDYNQAIYQYNNLVLNAVKEVLTGISVQQNANKQLEEFKKVTAAQDRIFKLTTLRVQHNLNSILDQLNSQENFLRSQDQEMIALGNTIQATLMLIKALGGGYKMGEDFF